MATFSDHSILNQLVGPILADRFFSAYWGKSFLHAPGAAKSLTGLFSWSDLNSALEHQRLDYPRLRLEANRQRIDPAAYTIPRPTRRGVPLLRVDAERAYQYVQDGATIVLDSVDELVPTLSIFCEALTKLFSAHIQVNAYATTEHTPGFGLHWDDHDVFVIQISGRKRWKIYDFTRAWPLYRDVEENVPPTTPPVWDGLLVAGDVLYIPRGQWHDVVAIDEPTLHLTIGVNNPTSINLFTWFIDEMRRLSIFRQDLPQFADAEIKARYSKDLLNAINTKGLDEAFMLSFSALVPGVAGKIRELFADTLATHDGAISVLFACSELLRMIEVYGDHPRLKSPLQDLSGEFLARV